jgi:signal transduction histidine kinase
VRDILRLHGCSIEVRSTPGEGTTFVFTLPIGRRGTPADTPSQPGRQRARE